MNRLLGSESAEEIADILGISISTLRKHCNHIYHKLNISQRIELYDLITRRDSKVWRIAEAKKYLSFDI